MTLKERLQENREISWAIMEFLDFHLGYSVDGEDELTDEMSELIVKAENTFMCENSHNGWTSYVDDVYIGDVVDEGGMEFITSYFDYDKLFETMLSSGEIMEVKNGIYFTK